MKLIQLLLLTIGVSLVPWLSVEALIDELGLQARLLSASEFIIIKIAIYMHGCMRYTYIVLLLLIAVLDSGYHDIDTSAPT